jgi:triacylglycerol lipase
MKTMILSLILLCLAGPARGADYSKDPVLMVHGYFLPDFATWASIENKLVDDGWPPEYLFGQTFDSVVGCNPNHAEAIAESVAMIREVTGRDKIDLLAHSMGGLDCRYYIKYLCGYKYVKDVVMLAGANQGSVVACLDPLSCGAEQMCVGGYDGAWQDNPFLADLNACDMTPGDALRYTSVWTEWDEIIMPQENSILPGALNHELDTFAEHGTILLNKEAYEWVKTGLNGAGTNDVGPDGIGPCLTVCEDPAEPDPEVVEPVDDIVEPGPDIVGEVIEEPIEETFDGAPGPGTDAETPEDLKHPPPEDDAAGTPPGAEVSGDGTVGDGGAPPEDTATPATVHYLPPATAGGCSATRTSGSGWWLLLSLIVVSRRFLRPVP